MWPESSFINDVNTVKGVQQFRRYGVFYFSCTTIRSCQVNTFVKISRPFDAVTKGCRNSDYVNKDETLRQAVEVFNTTLTEVRSKRRSRPAKPRLSEETTMLTDERRQEI